jgi:hypothetical protein
LTSEYNVRVSKTERRRSEMNEPVYCENCGHFHFDYQACPDPNHGCGSYLCCIVFDDGDVVLTEAEDGISEML